jgi:hypothetical protein
MPAAQHAQESYQRLVTRLLSAELEEDKETVKKAWQRSDSTELVTFWMGVEDKRFVFARPDQREGTPGWQQ